MSLPRVSLSHIVLVNLLFVVVVIVGLWSTPRIPVDMYPDISFNTAVITTLWSGASADEVERLVTTKLEDEIRDIEGIKTLRSFSQADLSEVEIEWDEELSEIDYEAALNELRAAVDRVGDLPETAEEPIITELSVSEVNNVCMVAVTDQGGVEEFTLREVARDIERALERLPGVRKATLRGERDRELRVYVDRDRTVQYDLTLPEISSVIARNNQNVPAGLLALPNSEVAVRGMGNFTTPAQLAATVVKKDPGGAHVRLSDVARVEAGFERRRIYGRHNGLDTISVGVAKTNGADIIELVQRVREFVDDYQSRLPPGVSAEVTWDESELVKARMGVMASNVLVGVILVVFLLWFTVGFRNALIVTLGIPFSFLCGLLLFPLFDITINLISLVGFVMVSGMLVDHAIIIVENIYQRVERGDDVVEAIVKGVEEVMWPVIATVATTLAAFIPALMIRGPSGEFGSILPKTVIVTLLGSLFEALVILPAHYLDWGSRRHGAAGVDAAPGLFARLRVWSSRGRGAVERWIERFRDGYVRGQQQVLRHRYAFLAACLAALYFSYWGVRPLISVDLFPSDFDDLFVTLQAPTDFGVDQTNEVVRELEAEVAALGDDIERFTAFVGMGFSADQHPVYSSSYGILFVTLSRRGEAAENPHAAFERLRTRLEAFAASRPEQIENLLVQTPRHGPPLGKPVAVRIQAEDYAVAKRIAAEIKAQLASMPGVFNIEDNLPEGPLELRVALDEHRASLHGLTFEDVAVALRAANDGLVPSTFKDPRSDEDIDIRVLLEAAQRADMADLLEVEIRAPQGYRVKLGDVARLEVSRGYQRLYHYDARRSVVVYADVDEKNATSEAVNADLEIRFADIPQRFSGVNLVFGGEAEQTRRTFEDARRALGVALLAIYAILATLFRSYLQPLVVMSVVAFAFIGVFLGLAITGGSISMWVLYAGVGLAGIVVNDSLVLLDCVNQEQGRGTPIVEAVRIASFRRFRPILLTTLTTIAGLLPMALGLTGKSLVFGPFATAIVFGLLVASGLTLFVVPALYLTVEDVHARLGIRSRRRPVLPPTRGSGLAD